MDVSVLQHQLDTINVNRQTKKGILTVIDLKVNSEMKEVIVRIDNMEKRFEIVDHRFDQMEKRFDQRFDEMEKRFSAQFSMLKWMIGILAAMMSAFMTTLLLKI